MCGGCWNEGDVSMGRAHPESLPVLGDPAPRSCSAWGHLCLSSFFRLQHFPYCCSDDSYCWSLAGFHVVPVQTCAATFM
jgi:hypothetical protein